MSIDLNFVPNSAFPSHNAANSVEILTPNLIKQGDTQNGFRVRLLRQGVNANLTNATVLWSAADSKGTVVKDRLATILPNSEVSFEFSEAESAAWGALRIEFKVTYSNGKVEKFPSNDHVRLYITQSHDDLSRTPMPMVTLTQFKQEVDQKQAELQQSYNLFVEQITTVGHIEITYTNGFITRTVERSSGNIIRQTDIYYEGDLIIYTIEKDNLLGTTKRYDLVYDSNGNLSNVNVSDV